MKPSTRHQLMRRFKAEVLRRYELLFPHPTEARLITILGGTNLTIGAIRRNNRQMVITLSRGRLLRSERFRRAAIDSKTGLLANDIKWALKIMGRDYENNVVEMYEQDERLKEEGWRLCRIQARYLWEDPDKVRATVRSFVYN